MKRLALLVALLLLPLTARADDPWSKVPTVPPGVHYTPLTSAQMEKTAARIRTILAPDYAGQESLLGNLAVCGPGLWKSWRLEGAPPGVESIPANFKPGGPGQLFKSAHKLTALDSRLRKMLAADGGFRLRRPTTAELARFWAIIDFDIKEPLIMIETTKRTLLYYPDKLTWLDDYTSP